MSGASRNPLPAARCVMWHPHASPPLNELLDAIQRRGLAWTATDRTLSVIVQILAAPPAVPQGSPAIPTVLVLIDPAHLTHIDEVLDLVSRYRPRTALWVFDPADPGRLKSMQALEIFAKYLPAKVKDIDSTPDPNSTAPPRRLPLGQSQDHLRLTPAPTPSTSVPPTNSVLLSSRPPSTSVSTDELAMLIESTPPRQTGFRSVR